ncbi:hypothetical protein [Nocardioides sp. NPDC004968]|uniref:DUF6950 family protein n=1 Tax=Nocardioides sp. NPDC004968 TaxID=3155894 RepID=UPI0033BF3DD1
MTLAKYLRAGAARPFCWDSCDCCSWACGWVALRRGVDPSARWRGRYRTARGALLQIRRAGGDLLDVASEAMADAGLVPTEAPRPGDIGVVETDRGQALAIRTPTGWAAKAAAGITVAPFGCLRAWSV